MSDGFTKILSKGAWTPQIAAVLLLLKSLPDVEFTFRFYTGTEFRLHSCLGKCVCFRRLIDFTPAVRSGLFSAGMIVASDYSLSLSLSGVSSRRSSLVLMKKFNLPERSPHGRPILIMLLNVSRQC